MSYSNKVWVVYSSYEHGGGPPEAVFRTKHEAEKYVKDNEEDEDEGGWLEIAKFDLLTGQQV